jgi:hypothetical protein
MATDDMGMENWRQTYLGDEPIYCAAHEHPDEILCPGSDHEQDESAKVAKRLRYEDQGLRYLRGQPPRLLSTTLRGPFDKASGWENPWLPKRQPIQQLVDTTPFAQRSAKTVPAIKHILHEELEKLVGHNERTLATGDSMQCHLPSPDSHRDLQLAELTQLNTDKRSRIQEWASTVPIDTLHKDDFWAPDQGVAEVSHAGSSKKKRPAGKEWLKSKINKRTRTSHTASATASTPTPIPAVVPKPVSRATSVPIPTTQSNPSELTVNTFGRSLDMTTPCSSADKRDTRLRRQSSKGTRRVETSIFEDDPRTSKVEMKASASQHILSSTQPPTPTRSAITPNNEKLSGLPSRTNPQLALPLVVEPGRLGTLNKTETLLVPEAEVAGQQGTQNTDETAGEQDGEEADISFQSHLDQSFHYRVRPTRVETAVPSTPQDGTNCHKSQATQTGTPESENHGDIVTVQANQALHDTVPSERENASHEDQVMVEIVLSDDVAHQPPSNEVMEWPGISQLGGHEALKRVPLSLRMDADLLTTGEPKDTSIPPDSENAVLEEGQPLGNAAKESNIQTHVTTTEISFSEALVDEGSTLIGDVMDIDESTPLKMSEPPEMLGDIEVSTQAAAHAKEACSVGDNGKRSSQSIPASATVPTPRIGKEQPIAEVVMPNDESSAEPSFVMIQHSNMSLGAELVTSSRTVRPEGIEDNTYVKIKPVDNESPMNMTHDVTLQSPWVPDHFSRAGPDVHYIRSKSTEQDQFVPRPNHTSVLCASSLDRLQPELRPSQQCPRPEIDLAELPRTLHFVSTPEHPKSATPANGHGPHLSLPMGSQSYVQEESSESLNHDITMKSIEELMLEQLDQPDPQPTTPLLLEGRQSTPDVDLSIKSFAKFNTPSPKRKPMTFKYPRLSGERLPNTQILVDAAIINPWSSARSQPRSSRRVSFALLPGEEDGPDEPVPTSITRAASPPPRSSIQAGDEDVDDHFQNHFNAMRRRSGEEPKFRLGARLLPSSSQQKPSSPEVGAMAEAFKAADAHRSLGSPPDIQHNDDEHDGHEFNTVQSPWRNDSQNQGVDDVAAVLQNLDDFLNPRWDIEVEMDKATRAADGIENQGGKHRGEISFPDISVWDVV